MLARYYVSFEFGYTAMFFVIRSEANACTRDVKGQVICHHCNCMRALLTDDITHVLCLEVTVLAFAVII